MDMMRVKQVVRYGWKDAQGNLFMFIDILYCFFKYKMWSNQYKKEDFYHLSKEERREKGETYRKNGIIRDEWQRRFQSDKRLYAKYGAAKWEVGNRRREKRNKAYKEHYNTGDNLFVENDVQLCQQHYLNGSISIGKNVLLAKHTFIDYSGKVVIKDNVQLTNGVVIESHFHPFHSEWEQNRQQVVATQLTIEEGAVIGSRAVVLASCHYIGKYARIGAGAVVTKDVPDYAVVVGVPATVKRIMEH